MGKGFNNYMCKKFFHPASRDNLKRVWMAEQKSDSYKKKQEELRMQYEKEQDLYTNKAMLSKESKDKLSVNFMYEPPPGAKKEREREDNEPEYKFEWQRKFNAPREDYCKGDQEIRDQPFGIQVRNVRCIKCHKWGHINTDKECPMYNQSNSGQPLNDADPLQLIRQMREDGLTIKRGVLEAQQHLNVARRDTLRDMIPTDDEEDEAITPNEKEFLKSLTKKQKMKLLRKLEKMEEKKASKKNSDKKKKSKSKGKEKKSKKEHDKNGRHSTEDESSSEEEWVEEDEVNGNKRDRKDKSEERRKKKKRSRSSSEESSEEERDDGEKRRKEKMRGKGEREYHKNGKSSGSKHRNSRNSEEDESEDEERRERSSRKHTERRNRKENDRKRRSSPDSDYESDHAKRRRK